jgi:Cu+-exporting ATPase
MAALDISDSLKPDAAQTIANLKAMGIKTVLLSGDSEKKCALVANAIGVDSYKSGMLPLDKTIFIKQLMEQGPVVMVGDGINDAPSLETADIGISFGDATSVAMNAADVVIIGQGDLKSVVTAIDKGRLTLRTIKQNLFWAFAYNLVAIPIAAAGYLSPMVAALSMAFSDVVVIGNSLRIRLKN